MLTKWLPWREVVLKKYEVILKLIVISCQESYQIFSAKDPVSSKLF